MPMYYSKYVARLKKYNLHTTRTILLVGTTGLLDYQDYILINNFFKSLTKKTIYNNKIKY